MNQEAPIMRYASPVLLGILPAILYAPFLFGGRVLYWGVYLLQFYPWRQLAVEQVRAGHWPLWNPYLGGGTPLAANLQTAAFYPLNVLFLLLPVERAFAWELALHLVLAGLFAYGLGRTLRLSRFGATVCGLTYSLGGYLVARWVFPTMVCAAAWLPLLLTMTEKLVEPGIAGASDPRWAAGRGVRTAALALAVALQLLAGHAQTSFYSLVIIAAFALYRLAQRRGTSGNHLRRFLLTGGRWLLAILWGVALAAIQLLPTAELTLHSHRPGRLTDLQFAFELSFWPWRLITLVAPDFFGHPARDGYWAYGTYWEEAAYVGILPLILAGAALIAWRQRRASHRARTATDPARLKGEHDSVPGLHHPALATVPFFAALALLSLLLALGDHTPLYPLLFRYVPGFGFFQAPARLLIGYAIALPLLAGIGADTLRLTPRRRQALAFLVVLGLGMVLAGALTRWLVPGVRASMSASIIRLGLTLAPAAGVLRLRGHRLRGARWQAAVLALIVADLLAFGWGLAPGTEASVYHRPTATATFLQGQPSGRILVAPAYAQRIYDQYVSLRSFGSSQPDSLRELRESLIPNLNVPYHLPSVGNYDPLTVDLYRDLWNRIAGDRASPPDLERILPLANLLRARYLISDSTESSLCLPVLYRDGPTIYHNETALPEAFLVGRARVVEDEAVRLELLSDPGFDPRCEVLLSRPPVSDSSPDTGNEGVCTLMGTATVLRPGPDRVIIRIASDRAGYLVLTDTYYPGWQATVDGEAAEILPADHAFRAVWVGTGEHTVVFTYTPLSFRVGAWVTLAAGVVMVGVALQHIKRQYLLAGRGRLL